MVPTKVCAMPYEIVTEPPGVRAVFTGPVGVEEILAAVADLGDVESEYTIFDLTDADAVEFSVEELHRVTTHVRVGLARPTGYPCAITGSQSTVAEMTELYIQVQEYLSGSLLPAGSITEFFPDLDAAREWALRNLIATP